LLWLGLSDETAQVLELKEPPAPPSLHETEPDGDDGEEKVSVTVAVNVTALDAAVEAGFGDTAAVVGCSGGLETVRDEVPELATCVESPE
jgi:hypothetical protein